jgi:hypothetical protein
MGSGGVSWTVGCTYMALGSGVQFCDTTGCSTHCFRKLFFRRRKLFFRHTGKLTFFHTGKLTVRTSDVNLL